MGKLKKGDKRRELSVKQHKLVRALKNADSVAEAGRVAGYNTRQSANRAFHAVSEKMPEVMDRLGLTNEYLVDKCLRPLLHAKETKFFAHEGKVVDKVQVEALGIRDSALDKAFKLRGAYAKTDQKGVAIGGVFVSVGLLASDDAAAVIGG